VFFDSGHIAEAPVAIRNTYLQIAAAGVKPLTLGGDHFISYPILQALSRTHGPISLIHFDAHSDTWADDGVRIDHGTMFYQAAKTGIVYDVARIIANVDNINGLILLIKDQTFEYCFMFHGNNFRANRLLVDIYDCTYGCKVVEPACIFNGKIQLS